MAWMGFVCFFDILVSKTSASAKHDHHNCDGLGLSTTLSQNLQFEQVFIRDKKTLEAYNDNHTEREYFEQLLQTFRWNSSARLSPR